MKNVFVTGVTGLLGVHLANALLDQGYRITAIARDPEKYIGSRTGSIQLIKMGLWDDYDNYLMGIDAVIHVAAETATNLPKYTDYEKTNYDATIRLVEKAISYGVPRFIFVSTANTVGYGNLQLLGEETRSMTKPFDRLFYARSKMQAEQYLLSRKDVINVQILNPTFMIGPYDSKPSSGKIILMGMNKRWVFYPPGGKNFVPAKDVAQAIINCLAKGITGERYLIAGENLSYRDFFRKLAGITGHHPALVPIPRLLLRVLGFVGEGLRMLGMKTHLSLANMEALCIANYYSNRKSINDLQVVYTSLDDAIKEAVGYFEQMD